VRCTSAGPGGGEDGERYKFPAHNLSKTFKIQSLLSLHPVFWLVSPCPLRVGLLFQGEGGQICAAICREIQTIPFQPYG
jgi:hypothetical protein